MSSRKRRKVQKKVAKAPLKLFRLKIVKLLPIDYDDSDFCILSNNNKINRVLELEEDILSSAITNFGFRKIKKIFTEEFGKKRGNKSKEVMIQSLVSKFFGEEAKILTRETENENLEIIGRDFSDLQSVEFDGIYVGFDVISHILSFLVYDSNLMFQVGSVCKGFYISILSSWKSVSVSKKTMFQVSSLVLRSVQEIHIVESGGSFIQSELKHLLQNLSTKLRRIIFHSSFKSLQKTLLFFHKYVKKNKSPLIGVSEIRFNISNKNSARTYVNLLKNTISKKIDLNELFPSLTSFHHPFYPVLLKNTSLEELRFKTIASREMKDGYSGEKTNGTHKAMKELYSIDKIKKNIDPKKLKRLRLDFVSNFEQDPYLFDLVEHFNRIQKFDLVFKFKYILCRKKRYHGETDLSFLSKLGDLTQLSICSGIESHRTKYRHYGNRTWDSLCGSSSDYFNKSECVIFKNLHHFVILTDYLIQCSGIICVLKNAQQLKHFQVMCFASENSDSTDVDDIFQILSKNNSLNFFHMELKVVDGRKHYCFCTERNLHQGTQQFGVFGISDNRNYGWNGNAVDTEIPKYKFSNKITKFVRILRNERIKNFEIFCRNNESEKAIEWVELDKIVTKELGFKKDSRYEVFDPSDLDVNWTKCDEKDFHGYYSNDWYGSKIGFVVRNYTEI